MKILAINGSPRRNWNTATLLQKALDGAASKGAQTEMIHLYDLNYSGCTSCYSCKQMGDRHCCMMHDDLSRILKKMSMADGLIFGSPIIFGSLSSGMAGCLERFLFPYILYGGEIPSTGGHHVPSAFIFTRDALKDKFGYESGLDGYESIIKKVLGDETEILDFNEAPMECQDPYQIGVRVAEKVLKKK